MSDPQDQEQHWRHKPSGDVYWIELDGEEVSDAFGPVTGAPLTSEELSSLHFDAHGDIVQWILEHRDEFEVMPESFSPGA